MSGITNFHFDDPLPVSPAFAGSTPLHASREGIKGWVIGFRVLVVLYLLIFRIGENRD
jgi:hypothetical protein